MSFAYETPPVAADNASVPPPDFGEAAATLAREVRGLVHDHIELATLETRLVIHNTLRMVAISLFAALVLAGAWFALAGAAFYVLVSLAVAPAIAMVLLAAANVLLAFGSWLLLRRTSARLGWPAIQRTLKPLR